MSLPKPRSDETSEASPARCKGDQIRLDHTKGREVHRVDAVPLPPVERTDEGFLRAPATRIARTGVQEYSRSDGSAQRELRLPEFVFDGGSLSTLDGKPVVMGHPGLARPVDVSNARSLMRGTVSSPRRDNSDDRFVVGDVVVHDGSTIAEVENGGARELSAGYRVNLVPVPGGVHRRDGCPYDGTYADYYQTNIRYNHVALLPAGRANEGLHDRPVRLRLDGTGNQLRELDKMATIKIDGKDHEVPQEVADHLSQVSAKADTYDNKKEPSLDKLQELESRLTKAEARADAAEQKVKDLESSRTSEDQLRSDAALFNLRKEAEKVTRMNTADILNLDEAGLRREILKVHAPDVPSEKLENDAYVEARLDHIREGRNSATGLRDPSNRQDTSEARDDSYESPLVKAHQAREERKRGTARQ